MGWMASWMTSSTGESRELGVGCLTICCFRQGTVTIHLWRTSYYKHYRCKTIDCTGFNFVMMVFMNDLSDQHVSEGSGDDKGHMWVWFNNRFTYLVCNIFPRMCGPRTFQDSKFDSRSFGFPFDRDLTFPLSQDNIYRQVNTLAAQKVPSIGFVGFSFVGIRPVQLKFISSYKFMNNRK